MHAIFVVNPKAGAENRLDFLREAVGALPGCELYATTGRGDAADYVRRQCAEKHDEELRFIACGGDGTIHEVFNGAVGRSGVSVSCWPCGSGNDFVKVFGGAERFRDPAGLLTAPTRRLDLLRVGDRYAVNAVHFGLDTAVAIAVNEIRDKTGHGGKSAYIRGILRALITSMRNSFVVTVGGEVFNPDGVGLLCTLANGQYVGGSFRCAPRAKIDDGLIEVCLVDPVSRLRFFRLIGKYIKGEHLDDPAMQEVIHYRQAEVVEVSAPAGFAFSMDGEIIHENRFTVEIVPGALQLAVPEM